jgi:hypothetical protein
MRAKLWFSGRGERFERVQRKLTEIGESSAVKRFKATRGRSGCAKSELYRRLAASAVKGFYGCHASRLRRQDEVSRLPAVGLFDFFGFHGLSCAESLKGPGILRRDC